MYCTHCGTQLTHGANFCTSCGNTTNPNPNPNQNSKPLSDLEGELKYLLPMSTPPTAMIAGYLGLFSILILPAPFAVIFGLIGLHQIKKQENAYGKGRCWTGILLGSACSLLAIGLFLIP